MATYRRIAMWNLMQRVWTWVTDGPTHPTPDTDEDEPEGDLNKNSDATELAVSEPGPQWTVMLTAQSLGRITVPEWIRESEHIDGRVKVQIGHDSSFEKDIGVDGRIVVPAEIRERIDWTEGWSYMVEITPPEDGDE